MYGSEQNGVVPDFRGLHIQHELLGHILSSLEFIGKGTPVPIGIENTVLPRDVLEIPVRFEVVRYVDGVLFKEPLNLEILRLWVEPKQLEDPELQIDQRHGLWLQR
jgi:hypothetical protein